MRRWLPALLLVGCAQALTPARELGFEAHFPSPPAVVREGARCEYQLHTSDFDYTAGVIKLEQNEPLQGRSYRAEVERLQPRHSEARTPPFYGISQRLESQVRGQRALTWLTQNGEGRILYARVSQLKPNLERPLELERVFQEFTQGARL